MVPLTDCVPFLPKREGETGALAKIVVGGLSRRGYVTLVRSGEIVFNGQPIKTKDIESIEKATK